MILITVLGHSWPTCDHLQKHNSKTENISFLNQPHCHIVTAWKKSYKPLIRSVKRKAQNSMGLIIFTHSGSRYPGVPTTTVDTCVSPSSGKALDNPKSESLGYNFSFNKIFVVLTSLWMMGGLQPLCKYSNPAFRILDF